MKCVDFDPFLPEVVADECRDVGVVDKELVSVELVNDGSENRARFTMVGKHSQKAGEEAEGRFTIWRSFMPEMVGNWPEWSWPVTDLCEIFFLSRTCSPLTKRNRTNHLLTRYDSPICKLHYCKNLGFLDFSIFGQVLGFCPSLSWMMVMRVMPIMKETLHKTTISPDNIWIIKIKSF